MKFTDKFFDALRVRFRAICESLIVAGLAGRIRPRVAEFMLSAHTSVRARTAPMGAKPIASRRASLQESLCN